MPKGSGPTKRDLGLNHGVNGKGSKSRVTDMKAFRENFGNINWGPRIALRPDARMVPIIFDKPLKTLRELEEEHEWRLGL